MAALQAVGLTRLIGEGDGVTLVRDISLNFTAGEFVCITGPSGSGKSSLLYLLGLLDQPTAGDVLVDGRSTQRLSRDALADLRLAKLGFVFQFHFLLPEFSAFDNVVLPIRRLGRLRGRAADRRAEALLDRLGLAASMHKRPGQMSGGQRQRVAIARALANDPPVVLADEPTGNLDTHNATEVFRLFQEIAAEGRLVVAVTHDLDLAREASRRVHLVDGALAPVPGVALD